MERCCDARCWFADRDECDCICGGKNHKKGLDPKFKEEMEEKRELIKRYRKVRKSERRLSRKGRPSTDRSNKIRDLLIGKKKIPISGIDYDTGAEDDT